MAAGIVWTVPPSVLAANTAAWVARMLAAAATLGAYFAAQMEAFAKGNAPWTDRTGHARQALTGVCLPAAAAVTIVIYQGASYGIWLEVKHGGRYAILLKTVQAFLPQVLAALRQLAGA